MKTPSRRTAASLRQRAGIVAAAAIAASVAGAQTTTPTVCIPFHRVTVVDADTNRGIPAVEIRTTDQRLFVTDSAGVVAVFDPDLMGKSVWLAPESFGHDFPPNGFGQRGQAVDMKPGGSSTLKMKRLNVAQRLYRITGLDMYRDSVLLGDKVPPTQGANPLPITGMDSVVSAAYKGKIYWFWGDTSVTRNPLGNFRTTGATSELPGKGGLDPDKGVCLSFFGDGGNVRPMFDDKHSPIWVGGARVARDEAGAEHLFINYAKIGRGMSTQEHGLAEFDDAAGRFRIVSQYPKDAAVVPTGSVLPHKEGGADYFYYADPWPFVRSPASMAGVKDLAALEAYTCLKQGVRKASGTSDLDRDEDGRLRWGWKKATARPEDGELRKLVTAGAMKATEMPTALSDVNTTMGVLPHSGSVFYNAHRKRWISIRCLHWHPATLLGETAYFEADTPLGPWVYGQRIVTHRMGDEGVDALTWSKKSARTYSFYNPAQDPEFDKDGGRIIYFEGTYTASFSGGEGQQTPGYNYNQMMYKLDLDDARVFMPVPVYRVEGSPAKYRTKEGLPEGKAEVSRAFFAPDRQRKGTVPVYEAAGGAGKAAPLTLAKPQEPGAPEAMPVFFAADPSAKIEADSPLVELHEFTADSGDRVYTTDAAFAKPGYKRSDKPLCRVWPSPIEFDPLAWEKAGR
jgi:hypothetical protein